MEMARITFSSEAELNAYDLQAPQNADRLHTLKTRVDFQKVQADRPSIACIPSDAPADVIEFEEALRLHLGETLAAHILQWWEGRLLEDLVRKRVDDADDEERSTIVRFCRQVLDPDDPTQLWPDPADRIERRQLQHKIASEVTGFLREHDRLDVEGFVRFRLVSLREELIDVVDYAIDEFILERQYQEFISLLKYFVYMQEARVPVAHLIHKGDYEFELLDGQLRPIEGEALEGFVVEMVDRDMNFEDMIVSTLISVSPQQIYIHTREPELQVLKTVRQIFEGRAILCTSCASCRTYFHGDCKHSRKTTVKRL